MPTVVGPSTEHEMIATFLLAEVDSTRFGEGLREALAEHHVDEAIIRFPDTEDENENRIRREVLTTYRGWGQHESVFGGLPADDIEWKWVLLTEGELRERVFTISWYFEETLGTRRPAELAEMKKRHDPDDERWVTEYVRSGLMPVPPILLAEPDLGRLVILEGHSRIISYLMDPQTMSFPIRALVGVSSRISEWGEW